MAADINTYLHTARNVRSSIDEPGRKFKLTLTLKNSCTQKLYMSYIKVYSNPHFTTICFCSKPFPNNRYTSLITIRFWHILMVDQRTKYAAPLWTCRTELLFWRQFPIIGVQILPGPQETHLLCTSVCENPVRILRSLSVELGRTSVCLELAARSISITSKCTQHLLKYYECMPNLGQYKSYFNCWKHSFNL